MIWKKDKGITKIKLIHVHVIGLNLDHSICVLSDYFFDL